MTLLRITARLTFWVLIVGLAAAMFLPSLFGYERYVIAGHSMTGTIPIGSLVYSKQVPAKQLKVNDIVTVVPPWDSKPVTHRVVKIGSIVNRQRERETTFRLKGDHNENVDAAPITLKRAALYHFHIPVVGWVFIYLSRYALFIIGFPALILGVIPMIRLWRESAEGDRYGATGYENIRRLTDVQ